MPPHPDRLWNPPKPRIQWVLKQLGRETDHKFPSGVEIKDAWSYTSTPPVRLHGAMLS
jgi:hypothetical protein